MTKSLFAENLERLSGLHGLTMREVAQLSGVSESVISKWSRGVRRPGFESALAIGGVFGISADRLANATIVELLQPEIVSEARFLEVERKIAELRGKPSNVIPFAAQRLRKGSK
jgi:transcriptional regulator with XRE-family HTH domain